MTSRDALRTTFALPIVRRSLAIAVIVGTILNLINQGDAVMNGQAIILWKIVLTYAVPFAVASYGSYSALRSV